MSRELKCGLRWRARVFALLLVLLASSIASAGDREGPTVGALGAVSGEQVYRQVCQGCHMPDGRGAIGGASYPSFERAPAVASSRYMAVTILGGRRNMPAFSRARAPQAFFPPTWLTDAEIASVINYIRTHFGNDYRNPITAAEVKALEP